MTEAGDLYAVLGAALFGLGLFAVLIQAHVLRKILAANVMGVGVFMVLVAGAWRGDGAPDPVPHALVITGIVVAVSATGFALALARRIALEDRAGRPPAPPSSLK